MPGARLHTSHPMLKINIQEQESRYAALRQGDKEYISMFKLRFDNQVNANEGAGMPAVTDSKRTIEFIYKLDQKRYKKMPIRGP